MKSVPVNLSDRAYEIIIGRSATAALSQIIGRIAPSRLIIISDPRVTALHRATLARELPATHFWITVPGGEESKSLDTAAAIYDQLAVERVERGDLVLAFGGGVIGDLAGFVAATWLRGLRFIQIPTTLEAAIDASVGGKTAVNHSAGKNMIGVFHQPSAVIVDLDLLATLPQREFTAGLAESVKHAAIRDADFFEWQERLAPQIIERSPDVLETLIARNCAIKASVVANDERESGLRAILNYGHTIGHAIEHELGFALRHGECVALGISIENRMAVARGLLNPQISARIDALQAALGLPAHLPRSVPSGDIVSRCRTDKKVRDGRVHMAWIRALGDPEIVSDVRDDEITSALAPSMP